MCAKSFRWWLSVFFCSLVLLLVAIMHVAGQEATQGLVLSPPQPPSLTSTLQSCEATLLQLRSSLLEQKQTASAQAQSSQSTALALSGAIQSDAQSSSASSAQSTKVQGALSSSVQASTQTSDSLTAASAMSASLKTDFDDYRRKAAAEIFWWRSAALISAGTAAGALADGPRGALYGAGGGAATALIWAVVGLFHHPAPSGS